MIVIPDASPLISLAIIDKLNLLNEIFDEIVVPSKVLEEISVVDKKQSSKIYNWGKVYEKNCKNTNAYNAYRLILDSGESECLVLANEIQNSILLFDDKKARKIAEIEKQNFVGTIGILIKAKRVGLIESIKPLLDNLINEDIYLSKELYQQSLKLSSE